MTIFDIEVARIDLEDLIDRAKKGEEIFIRDGNDLVKIEPVNDETIALP